MRNLVWVDRPEALDKAVEELSRHTSIALDAEMDSFFVYHTKLCLMQISAGETDFLVDTLALEDLTALNAVTQDDRIRKVVHAGENDIPYFRGRGVTFNNLFDTHVVARLLDLPSKGLAGLVEIYFQVVLSKEHQRSDWRLRPLPAEQIAYARQDTLYLNELADLLIEPLREGGAMVEAVEAFQSLEKFEVRKKEWDPDGWAKISGARDLTGVQRAALAGLYKWRDALADGLDLALFRVVSNGALLALARKKFTDPEEIRRWSKISWIREDAEKLVRILAEARQGDGVPFPDVGRKRFGGLSPADEAVFSRLREWRNEESRRQNIVSERVFSNRQLKSISVSRPRDMEGLRGVEGLESWRVEQFGATLLELLGD